MKYFILALLLLILSPTTIFASSRQPVVSMNFATINELNWSAPEEEWTTKIKPEVIKQVMGMRKTLHGTAPQSDGNPLLAWSTLMEYMNFPMDTPSEDSVYAIKTRRILEIAEELDFPVFIPLNGFQWWDELPELYNWWDEDGTHTDPKFFARQDNPEEFKKRFIAGYNPDNIWNVEWQSYKTPMKLNYRNWGGGGFRLAPPPNLTNHHKTPQTYRSVQRERLKVIVQEIAKKYEEWKNEGKEYLFAGITIGTEVSLNASVTPQDEFEPYGYRGVQDLVCPTDTPNCKSKDTLPQPEFEHARQQVVRSYLEDNARLAVNTGIPKELIYTHVWSEAKAGEDRYTNYIGGAFNLYSNPGISLYGYAQDPLSLPDLQKSLEQYGNPPWGAVEYSAGTESNGWKKGLRNSFTNTQAQASVMIIYNWNEHKDTGAVPAIKSFLSSPIQASCSLPTVVPITPNYARDPENLEWRMTDTVVSPLATKMIVRIQKGIVARIDAKDTETIVVSDPNTTVSIPTVPFGNYVWFTETIGCNGKRKIFSQPQVMTISYTNKPDTTPKWVQYFLTTN